MDTESVRLEPKVQELPEVQQLQLEETNFRVNTDGWVKRISREGQEYLEAPTADIWELINCKEYPELNGQQLFTWDAAMRETERAGRRMPTEEEWNVLLKTKKDMPNLILAGFRNTDGSFNFLSSYGYFWTSLQSGSYAWGRGLSSSYTSVYRNAYYKAYGFSVRCVKN